MQYLTAYGALIDIADLKSGETVLIPAASSSVGLAAIQIAKKVGAVPVALTRGRSKVQAIMDAGATQVIATDERDLVEEVLRITGGKGARVVFDPVGGPTITKLAQATTKLGTLFLYGALSTEPTPLPLMDVLGKRLTLRGYVMMEITGDPKRLERGKRFINDPGRASVPWLKLFFFIPRRCRRVRTRKRNVHERGCLCVDGSRGNSECRRPPSRIRIRLPLPIALYLHLWLGVRPGNASPSLPYKIAPSPVH